MTHAGSSPDPSDASYGAPTGASSGASSAPRYSGRLSGLSYEAERCPECGSGEQLKGAAGGGLIGWGLTLLLGASPGGRLLGAGVGAVVGALASRWHLRLDWDPEALRGARQEA